MFGTAYLAAECAEVLGVLADLHLLDNLTETRAIASSVLTNDAHLLGALRLRQRRQVGEGGVIFHRGVLGTNHPATPQKRKRDLPFFMAKYSAHQSKDRSQPRPLPLSGGGERQSGESGDICTVLCSYQLRANLDIICSICCIHCCYSL